MSEIDNNSEEIIQNERKKIMENIKEIVGDRGYNEKFEYIFKINVQKWEWDRAIFEGIIAEN